MVKLIIPRVPDRLYLIRSAIGGWLLRFAEWLEWAFYCLGAWFLGGYMVEVSEDEHRVSEDD